MNKKGFAISGVVYSVLILFLILIFGIIGILGSRKLVLDKMKNNVISELNNEELSSIYVDDSGANYPKLLDRMIPVIYDETAEKWVYADIYEKWYDYDSKMWANAVVLKNGIVKAVGQEIEEEEIALMYVWIPRFKYVMFNANGEEVEEQQIEVIFENDTNSTGTVKCVDAINQTDSNGNLISEICTDITNNTIVNGASTYTHPAFTFGDDEIEGFWVGKFENSTTDGTCLNEANENNCNKDTHMIEIKANSDSLRYINISNMFTSIQNINNNYGITDADSHMIKNMEWGAVAYLTQSKYGRCTNGVCEEVVKNNVVKNEITYTTQTGCAASQNSIERSSVCENEYNTIGGVKASTTGNVYGVYDMHGGTWDSVMSNNADINGDFVVGQSDFSNIILEKYYDIYSYSSVSDDTLTRGRYGDGTKEISFWNDSIYKNFSSIYQPWLYRSTHAINPIEDGLYVFVSNTGGTDYGVGSRSILIKQ